MPQEPEQAPQCRQLRSRTQERDPRAACSTCHLSGGHHTWNTHPSHLPSALPRCETKHKQVPTTARMVLGIACVYFPPPGTAASPSPLVRAWGEGLAQHLRNLSRPPTHQEEDAGLGAFAGAAAFTWRTEQKLSKVQAKAFWGDRNETNSCLS